MKFDSSIYETLPEDRFGEFIKPRMAESKDNLEEMEKEGKLVMKKVTLKNGQGQIIKQYHEEVKQ